MVKKTKSKNAIIKKAKKLERQGKYKKSLKVCDDFLDKNLDLNILEIKIDLINTYYFSEEFLEKINNYQNTLTHFLSKEEEDYLLKIYSAIKNKMNYYSQNYDNLYLIGGLLLDSLKSILILNEHIKNIVPNEDIKKIPEDLNIFRKDIEKTAKQYLILNNGNLNEILSKEINYKDKTKEEIKELTKFIENKKESEDTKSLKENKEKEKTIKTLLNEAIKYTNENNEKALNLINEGLMLDKKNINILEHKIVLLNKMQRFEEALTTQKLLVKIAKNLDLDISENKKENLDLDKYQTTLFEF